jgi:hypothetical protein
VTDDGIKLFGEQYDQSDLRGLMGRTITKSQVDGRKNAATGLSQAIYSSQVLLKWI